MPPLKIGFACACCRNKGTREREEAKSGPYPDGVPMEFLCGVCDEKGISLPDMSVHTIPVETGVVVLDACQAFEGLTGQERSYALGLSQADWAGAKICLLQCSPESVPIFALLQLVFSAQPVPDLISAALSLGLSQEEVDQALMYCASFYGNVGNYKSFGDTKFVPQLAQERLEKFLLAGKAPKAEVEKLLGECQDAMYSLKPRQRQMGLGAANGISTYFSGNCEEADAEIAGRFLESHCLSPYNTRLFKEDDKYIVLLASAREGDGADAVGKLCSTHDFEGNKFEIRRGDYAPLMGRVVDGLKQAIPNAANAEQTAMLEKYVESFSLGSVAAHMDASRHWIKDKGPAVESYIGFIESYRDPSGVRGEWEGFTACVNREVSKKFGLLVDQAEMLLTKMPWPKDFEKDKFLRPDFTSLDVLAFGSSGVPAGINIPNYDDIRQSEGFKNVSLGNVLAASYGAKGNPKPVSFLKAEDQTLYKNLQGEAFEVQVGVHELLGHGSGKLFMKDELPSFKDVLNPLTGETVKGPFYATGSTWDTTFGKMASTYEECRAEATGIYLSLEKEVLAVFGHEVGDSATVCDITYINWLHMARAGLLGLEFYTPETGGWRQAHMQARYVLLRVMLEAGQGLLELKSTTGSDGKPDIQVIMDRALIPTVGKEAVGKFLLALQVYKTLGDFGGGSAMYSKYSAVPEEMLVRRAIVMARKEARKLLVQPHLKADSEGKVELQCFSATPTGMIESFVARFPSVDPELMALYEKEKPAHASSA